MCILNRRALLEKDPTDVNSITDTDPHRLSDIGDTWSNSTTWSYRQIQEVDDFIKESPNYDSVCKATPSKASGIAKNRKLNINSAILF